MQARSQTVPWRLQSNKADGAERCSNPIEARKESPLLAQSGHPSLHRTCPLLGEKRTCDFALQMSAFDPKRTSAHSQPPYPNRGGNRNEGAKEQQKFDDLISH